MNKLQLVITGATLLLATLADNVCASGFQLFKQNASGTGAAYASLAAVAEDASTVFFNPDGMAWLANGKMHLAVGLAAIPPSAKFYNPTAMLPFATGASLDGNGSDTAWGYNLGTLFQVTPATSLGLSYRSAIKHHLTGEANFSRGTGIDSPLYLPFSSARSGAGYSDINLPETFVFSGQHHLNEKWILLADLSRTAWGKIPKSQSGYASDNSSLSYTNKNWSDTWRAAFGGVYKYSDIWKLKMGLVYDKSPVGGPMYRTPRLTDSNRKWLSLGGQYKFGQDSAVDFGYTHIFIKEGALADDGTATSQTAPLNLNGNVSLGLQGKSSNQVDMFGVQYSHSF